MKDITNFINEDSNSNKIQKLADGIFKEYNTPEDTLSFLYDFVLTAYKNNQLRKRPFEELMSVLDKLTDTDEISIDDWTLSDNDIILIWKKK